MAVLITVFVFSFITYLALTAGTAGSAGFLLWSLEEIIFGILFSVLAALLAKKISRVLGVKPRLGWLNPVRWFMFLAYAIGPFFFNMAKANLDVACRVITGKIRPGIVRISPGLKTDFGITMLANSITLTPGTLSVDVDSEKNLYVHCIYVRHKKPKTEEVCSSFPRWVRRIAE